MRRPLFSVFLLAGLALFAAACGGDSGTNGGQPTPDASSQIIPIPANSELVVGPNRFALGLVDGENNPILEDAGTKVHLSFSYEDQLKYEQDAGFVWAIPDVRGLFVATVDFGHAGQWTAEATLTRDGAETAVTFTFTARACVATLCGHS